ncbi:unnamed protein product [Prorocentrum cordatum]|uniref:Uncharacterized protein n=1 Tax=Prorocentrum cordatum TaxID=2364126 RepID=A0ABN9TQJ3_9DINO|nr:unnamed protein product [Polarella glacialis]
MLLLRTPAWRSCSRTRCGGWAETRGSSILVVVNLVDAYWRPASQTTRVPRTLGFVRALRDAVAPNGIVVQEVGTVQTPLEALRKLDLHRAVFGSVWPMTGSALDNDLLTSDELDGCGAATRAC